MNKTKLILAGASLLFASTFVSAQTRTETVPVATYQPSEFGAVKGEWEFTLGGSGASNKDLDNSLGGVNFSLGHYLTDSLELSVRQSGNYSNGSGDAEFDGSTFGALDYHFGTGRLRPFVGVNFGAIYGENTSDTWAAGLEAGLKFYVLPKTFLFALVNYAWTFENADGAQDNFDDGAVLWNAGVGFNF
ncbi:outer membrane beta-barrel protein [Rariglobus hedericola]|uniref:Porin family protein n=1 Tax=Rariglobus hedericola TaxID=2597822 RepID=A0A556QLA6_9BACT|nr:outer membrane beta-barrel protein [Rariglobus hedericola]TSJ77429.1 porin family protein [Rariglobus hedericola]